MFEVDRIIDESVLDETVLGLLGGDRARFFREYFRQQPLSVPGTAKPFANAYDVEAFLSDLASSSMPPFVSVGAGEAGQRYALHGTRDELHAAVLAGDVASIKLSGVWYRAEAPERFRWMRELFHRLLRAVAMTYLDPRRSEDCDLFLAGPDSSLGTHFDTTDVFTIQLAGRRKWTLDSAVDLDALFGPKRDRSWPRGAEVPFQTTKHEVVLEPGDALYVPAHCVHRVTGISWSVALSLGLRAVNEIDVVEHLLEKLRVTSYAKRQFLPSYPESDREAWSNAKLELTRRIRTLLGELDMMATWSAIAPIELPRGD